MRRIAFKNIKFRLVALAVVLLSLLGVRYYTSSTVNRHVFYVDIPPPMETEAGDRDLTQYEFGGRIENCELAAEKERCYTSRDDARNFIEEHFKTHRRGYVIIDGASLDLPPTAWFFVEPTENGKWEVRVRISMPGPYTRFHRNMNTHYYTEVFRRRVGNGELNIKPGTTALILRSRGVYELAL